MNVQKVPFINLVWKETHVERWKRDRHKAQPSSFYLDGSFPLGSRFVSNLPLPPTVRPPSIFLHLLEL